MIVLSSNLVKLDLDLDLDPHSEKLLYPDLDPHKKNADPQPFIPIYVQYICTGSSSKPGLRLLRSVFDPNPT